MRLMELREERNLTQNDIARAIDTSRTNIGRWEKGLNEPAASYLIKLAEFFEVSTDYLLGLEDDIGIKKFSAPIKNEKPDELSPDGKELLAIFNSLDSDYQAQILGYARYCSSCAGTKNIKTPKENNL